MPGHGAPTGGRASSQGPAAADDHACDELVEGLTKILDRAVRELSNKGEAPLAGVLSARAWSLLRRRYPTLAEHLNRTMHYIARRDTEVPNPQHT